MECGGRAERNSAERRHRFELFSKSLNVRKRCRRCALPPHSKAQAFLARTACFRLDACFIINLSVNRHLFSFAFAPLFAACVLLATTIARAADAPTPAAAPQAALENYNTSTIGDAVFVYPPDERPFVDEIAASYTFPIRLLDQKSFDAQMDRWKKHDLPLMAKLLGLPQPTDAMNAAFEQFREFCKPTIEEGIGEVRIYRFADLRDAAAKGVKIEGVNYVPESNSLSIALYISVERTLADGTKKKFRVVPIVLPEPLPDDLATRMRIFNGTLRDMRWRLDEAIYNAYSGRIFEIMRPEIVATVNQSRFPLWLMEGMTNAIPLVIIRSHNPNLTFEQILSARSAQLPPDFKKLAAGIDLDFWAMTRKPQPPSTEERNSYVYLALLVTLDAIEENGEGWLPEFFNRLRRENSPSLNMAVVQKIFADVTGKDLRDSVARVREKLAGGEAK